MKKIFVLFFTGIVVTAAILLFITHGENIMQEDQPSITYTTSSPVPTNKPQELLPESAAPASNKSIDILLVNAENPLPDDYRSENLINLYNQKHKHFQLAKADIEVCRIVFDAMESMFSAAEKDGVDGFIITSGYRSHDQQKEVFANSPDGIAAQPGTSEHETGLAFDVTAYGNENFELTPQFEWLSKHCSEYGFILRYPKGSESITGYSYEPWHYRYVGTPYAKEIMDAGITLEEYMEQ